MDDLFQCQYRVPSARAEWHAYDGGLYFVTICTADRTYSFGEITDGVMSLSELGRYVDEAVLQVPVHHSYAEIPLHVVMPNHIHMIVYIDGNKIPFDRRQVIADDTIPPCRDVACRVSLSEPRNTTGLESRDAAGHVSTRGNTGERMRMIAKQQGWLSVVIGSFKSSVTRFANQSSIPIAWQTRFHEHIIRSREEGNRIAEYIENNVARWDTDCFYKKDHSPL